MNALKSTTESKRKKLEELQTQYEQMIKDASAAEELDKGESEAAQVKHSTSLYTCPAWA